MVVEINGVETIYTIAAILDYTNARKRMSVIVEHPDGKVFVYLKVHQPRLCASGGGGVCSVLHAATHLPGVCAAISHRALTASCSSALPRARRTMRARRAPTWYVDTEPPTVEAPPSSLLPPHR